MTVTHTEVSKQESVLSFACQGYCLQWSDIWRRGGL